MMEAMMNNMRLCDAVSPGPARGVLSVASLIGTWFNTKRETRGIARLAIAAQRDTLTLRAFGTHSDGLVDWGLSSPILTYAADAEGTETSAFTTSFELPGARIDLEGNFNRGVLVLACYTSYRGAAQRAPVFLREYYAVRADDKQAALFPIVVPLGPSPSTLAKLEDLDPGIPVRLDPAAMAGHFVNTKAADPDLLDVTIRDDGQGGCWLRLRGNTPRGPVDWGEVTGQLFTCIEEDSRLSLTLRAVFQLDPMDVIVQVRNNKGVTVIATFAAWKDGSGRANYFTREFFRRA
jgi:hypothetical protein